MGGAAAAAAEEVAADSAAEQQSCCAAALLLSASLSLRRGFTVTRRPPSQKKRAIGGILAKPESPDFSKRRAARAGVACRNTAERLQMISGDQYYHLSGSALRCCSALPLLAQQQRSRPTSCCSSDRRSRVKLTQREESTKQALCFFCRVAGRCRMDFLGPPSKKSKQNGTFDLPDRKNFFAGLRPRPHPVRS